MRPGLSLAGFQLSVSHRIGLPVLRPTSLYMHAVVTTPAVSAGPLFARLTSSGGLPCYSTRSAPALPFSRLARRSLALRPACSLNHQVTLFHRRLHRLHCFPRCSDCYRLERPLAGWDFHPL